MAALTYLMQLTEKLNLLLTVMYFLYRVQKTNTKNKSSDICVFHLQTFCVYIYMYIYIYIKFCIRNMHYRVCRRPPHGILCWTVRGPRDSFPNFERDRKLVQHLNRRLNKDIQRFFRIFIPIRSNSLASYHSKQCVLSRNYLMPAMKWHEGYIYIYLVFISVFRVMSCISVHGVSWWGDNNRFKECGLKGSKQN
jgi:hypothetical protein